MWRSKPRNKVLIHSNQDSQFTSMDWASFLMAHNLKHSMSRRGNYHDNAVVDSFFYLLKRERMWRWTYKTRAEARQDVFTTSRCSTTRSASTSGLGCCRPSSSNGSRKRGPRVSRKLGAIQISPSASILALAYRVGRHRPGTERLWCVWIKERGQDACGQTQQNDRGWGGR